MRDHQELLERAQALAATDEALQGALSGGAHGVWFEGAPGLGTSALLAEARRRGTALGMQVRAARALDVTQRCAYGVARSMLGDGEHPQRPEAEQPSGDLRSMMDRLTDALLATAGRGPLLLVADDLHWADTPSLRWLLSLVPRLGDVPVALIVGARPHEPRRPDALRQLATQALFSRVQLASLTPAGTTAVVRAARPDAADALCSAYAHLTAGNPLLLTRLLALTAEHRRTPARLTGAAVEELPLGTVLDDVLVRMARLRGPAGRVLEAVAVLGDGAHLDEIADVCGLQVADVGPVVDALADIDVLARQLPVAFAQPLVRAAVRQGMPVARRAALHRLAAKALADHAVAPARIAAHLLEAASAADPWVVAHLRSAARRAVRQGAPDVAAGYLRRALDEPPLGREQIAVLCELAEAEAAAGDDRACARMEHALELDGGSPERPELLLRHAWLLHRAGRVAEAAEVIAASAPLPAPSRRVRAELACARLAVGGVLGHMGHDAAERYVAALDSGAKDGRIEKGAARRAALIQEGTALALGARDHRRARDRVAEALGQGGMLAEEGVSLTYTIAVSVLSWCDALVPAVAELTRALEHSRRVGDVPLEALVRCARAQPRHWAGDLHGAVADAAAAVDTWQARQRATEIVARCWLARSLLELDDVRGAAAALGAVDPAWSPTTRAAWHAAYGRVALVRGDVEAAWEALARSRDVDAAVPFLTSAMSAPWRPDAALAAHLAGEVAEARRLADEDLARARSFGAPRALGIALRTAALVASGDRRLVLLAEAEQELERSPAVLERCRTQVDLGAELRRQGQRAAAREPLRRGLDMARRRGLVALERRALEELRAAGGRPRRLDLSGAGALTPTERRVAALAAEGRSNREISQLLFVTRKTVEWHLSHAFRKLEVAGRADLAVVLGTDEAVAG